MSRRQEQLDPGFAEELDDREEDIKALMLQQSNSPELIAFQELARTKTAIFLKATFTSVPTLETICRVQKTNGFPLDVYSAPRNLKILGRYALWNINIAQ